MGYKVWVSRLEDCLQKSLRDLPFTVTYFQIKLCLWEGFERQGRTRSFGREGCKSGGRREK